MSSQIAHCPVCGGAVRFGPVTSQLIRCPHCGQAVQLGSSPLMQSRPTQGKKNPWPYLAGAGGGALLFLLVLGVIAMNRRPQVAEQSPPQAEPLTPAAEAPQAPSRPEKRSGRPPPPPRPAHGSLSTPPPAKHLPVSLDAEGDLAASGSALRYGWRKGDCYAFSYSLRLSHGDEEISMTGYAVYQPKSLTSSAEAADGERSTTGSGTAFVVNSHGYLMTCEHVVGDASKIEVVLGGDTYPARVIATDEKHDLAILRIEATGLPVLPLADSDRIRLAEDVRVIGYPLSDVLGSSVKVTRGSIAGFVTEEDTKLLQVDAAVNAGNSGGPLVDESGAVVGVVSAKLAGEEISNVGFSIPVNVAKGMLREHGIPCATGGGGPSLDGPELASRVTPAVAFVSVRFDPEGIGHGERFLFAFEGCANVTLTRSTGERVPLMRSKRYAQATMIVDEYGEVLHTQGDQLAPSFLGPLGEKPWVQLSHRGETSWQVERVTSIVQIAEPSSPGGGLGYDRPGVSPYRRRRPGIRTQAIIVLPAVERTSYELGGSTGSERRIVRTEHELKTLQRAGRAPFRLSGKGSMSFDVTRRLPLSASYQATVADQAEDGSSGLSISVIYASADVTAALKELGTRRTVARSAAPGPMSPEELDDVIATLRTTPEHSLERRTMLEALARTAPVEEKREMVCEAIRPLLSSGPYSVNREAAMALSVWGDEEDLLELAMNWDDIEAFTRTTVVRRLGEAKTERAASALVTLYVEEYATGVTQALREMGPVAEEPVIPLLGHSSSSRRAEACRILGDVGTRRSIAPLSRVMRSDRSSYVRDAARAATRKIRMENRDQ